MVRQYDVGWPKLATHTSKRAEATVTAVIFCKDRQRMTLGNRSVKSRTNRLRATDFGKGPTMSTLTFVKGSHFGKIRMDAVCRRRARRICAHAEHRVTTP